MGQEVREELTLELATIKSEIESGHVTLIDGKLTPEAIVAARKNHFDRYNVYPTKVVIQASGWSEIATAEFANLFDPCTKYESIVAGKLGVVLGCDLYTDGFSNPDLKFLKHNYVM